MQRLQMPPSGPPDAAPTDIPDALTLEILDLALGSQAEPARILDLRQDGQVTGALRARFPRADITTRDFEATADFQAPDLAGTYDLIWTGSLATRLSERRTRVLLDLAWRHMGPQSVLVLVSQRSQLGRGWFEDTTRASPLRLETYREPAPGTPWDAMVIRLDPVFAANAKPGGLAALRARLLNAKSKAVSVNSPWFADLARLEACAPELSDDAPTAFDEAFYRQANADVAAAIAAGSYASGLEHYLAHGRAEGRLPAARADLDHGAKVNAVWSADTQARTDREGWYWMAHPAVRARLAVLASDDPAIDAYDHLADLLRQRGWTLPIRRSLSLGCGFGNLERDLTHRGLVGQIEAYDLAEGAIEKARELAAAAGYGNIRYHVADLEVHELPRDGFDVVFAHQSVHHVDRLEHMFARVAAALRPGGIFHLHEFVGPIRFQWTDAQIGLINSYLDSLPPELRRLPSGEAKPSQGRPTVEAMIAADPSEAIRSSDIRTALAAQFEIIEERPLGGTLAHLALAGIAQNFDADRPDHQARLQELFDLEDTNMRQGVIGSDFVVLTALKA